MTVKDSNGPVIATVKAVMGGVELQPAGINGNKTGSNGAAVTFQFKRGQTGDINITATADDGRQGTTVVTVG